MIFIGPDLSDPHAHFVTNIVSCIGTDNDLVIDLYQTNRWEDIKESIAAHLGAYDESYVIYNAYEDEDFFIYLKHTFPQLKLITVFSDDEWRHANYDRYLALYSDISAITDVGHYARYADYGIQVCYMPWACNPDSFYPVSVREKYDVSFIGAAYGARIEYIRFLISVGIEVQVFGRGWERYADIRPYWGGFLIHEEMLQVISQSRINLNFLWTSAASTLSVIKGRLMELAACRAFQLTSPTVDLERNGFINGDNITVFHDKQELLAKIEYYLAHADERERIAEQAYEHVLEKHTWQQRFQSIFVQLGRSVTAPPHKLKKYSIMVVLKKGIQHHIQCDDERLEIKFVDSNQGWQHESAQVDGVIQLTHDSSINNESLYMMAFGLCADQSDVIAANFYVGVGKNRAWIRFRDRFIDKRRDLLKMLPQACLMFSGAYASTYGAKMPLNLNGCNVSYIEYPSFEVLLSYLSARKLRLYFAHHRDPRALLRFYVKSLQWGKALSLGMDKLWQK